MIQDKIFFDEKDPTGVSYNTPFTVYGSYQGRLWSKTPTGSIKYYTQNSDLSVYATTGSNQFSGSQTVTGSLTVTGGITGSVTTASYVEYTGVANKPTLVSSSAQIVGYNVFATTGSNQFNGSQAVTGSLTVTGQVVAQTLNVQQVTSSIVYSSGSNIFGNSLGNTQQFTGSLQVTGSTHYLLGNVGVGTTTPEGKLTIQGTASELPNSGTTANSLIQLKSNLSTELNIGLNTVSGDYGAYIQASDNNLAVPYGLYLQPNGGNVGIGTIKARGLLQLFGPEIAAYKTYTGQGNTGGGDTIINAYRLDAASLYLRVTDIVALGDDTNNRGSSIRLMTTNTSGVTSAALTIAPTGASTFSNTTSGNALRLFTSYASGRALNFGFSDGSVLPTAAFYIGNQTNVGVFIGDETTTNGLYVKLDGNVGIGTTSPSTRLHVTNTSAGESRVALFLHNNSTTLNTETRLAFAANSNDEVSSNRYSYISALNTSSSNGQALIFATNETGAAAVERMRITSAGNVGIGTTSPSANLHVVRAGDGGSGTPGVILSTGNGANDIVRFQDGTTTVAVVKNSGNMGIGTASPDVTGFGWRTLTIKGGAASGDAGVLELQSPATTGAANLGIIAFLDGSNRNAQIAGQRDGATNSGLLSFTTWNAGTGAERMRITSDGYVRLTTSSGGIQFNGDTAAANALDDYEEGTWTPVPTSTGATFSTVVNGTYTKIGRLVYIRLTLDNSSATTGTLTNQMTITGLPFTSSPNIGYGASLAIGFEVGIDYPAGGLGIQAIIPANTAYIGLRFTIDDASGDDFLASNFDGSDARIALAGCYEV
jgi:hypothetical protein